MGKSSQKKSKSKKSPSAVKNSKTSSNSGGSPSGKMSKSDSVKPDDNQNLNAMKKIWSLMDLVEAMKPTAHELKFRERKTKEKILSAGSSVFKCTKCDSKFKVTSDECEKVTVHPCLGVLMCKVCCDYYNDGEFSVDSEGEDKYCRWCGEGGTLFGCSKCICGFCMSCIKKHFGNEYLKQVEEDDDWLCFFCNPKPLWHERYICSIAIEMSQKKTSGASLVTANGKKGSKNHSNSKKKNRSSKKEKQPSVSNNKDLTESDCSSSSISLEKWRYGVSSKGEKGSKKRLYSSSSDESEIALPERNPKKMKFPSFSQQLQGLSKEESFENLKQMIVEELEKAVKLSEYQMAFGMKWTCKVSKRLADPRYIKTPEDLQKECLKVKCFLSALAAHLVEFCNSVDSAEKSIPKEDGFKDSSNLLQPPTDTTGFAGIIKFLSFITNQVNVFVKKGFSLSEVLEAEILHENNFIGLKTASRPSNTSAANESTCNISPGKSFNGSDADSEPNTKTREKVDESASSDEEPLKIVLEQDSKAQEESPNDSEDFNSSTPEMKDTKNDIRQIMQILENS